MSASWAGVTGPSGGAVDGYYVIRLAGATPTPACGSSAAALLPAAPTSCTDTGNPSGVGVPAGVYTYQVVAVWRSWSTSSAASNTVTVQPPTVTSTSPSVSDQGASGENVTITGTGFMSGAAATFSGAGITVNSAAFVSATSLTANITIAGAASTGARSVTVTNPDGDIATGTNVFTVNAGPAIASTTPSSRTRGPPARTSRSREPGLTAARHWPARSPGPGLP